MAPPRAFSTVGITLALSLGFLGVPAAFADTFPNVPSDATESRTEPQIAPDIPGLVDGASAPVDSTVRIAEADSAGATTRAAVTNAADYFSAMGATDAHLILTNASYTKYFSSIQLGSADSATSLPNLLLALDYIDEANALRVSESLDTLLVGDSLMAAAMANADHIRVTWAHPQQWGGLAENIAAGYRGPAFSTSSPFRGWFDKEKVLWNQAVASGDYPGLADMSAYQIYATYPALYSSVGHYLNIIDPGNKTTGFGVYTGSSSYPYYAQEFAGAKGTFFSTQNGKALAAGRLLSVADYRASVLSYAKDTAIAFDSAPTPVISGTSEVGNSPNARHLRDCQTGEHSDSDQSRDKRLRSRCRHSQLPVATQRPSHHRRNTNHLYPHYLRCRAKRVRASHGRKPPEESDDKDLCLGRGRPGIV